MEVLGGGQGSHRTPYIGWKGFGVTHDPKCGAGGGLGSHRTPYIGWKEFGVTHGGERGGNPKGEGGEEAIDGGVGGGRAHTGPQMWGGGGLRDP